MKLVVLSPEAHDPREISVVSALFAAGLERYHLRKPGWSAREMETWLNYFSPADRARMVVHCHFSLVERCGLLGAHQRDGISQDETIVAPGLRGRACHDLPTLHSVLGHCDSVLLSPIFASLSKPGYGPSRQFDLKEVELLLKNRRPEERRTEVFALGGIDEETTEECSRIGFDGVAVLGAIWKADDPVHVFKRLDELCRCLSSRVNRKDREVSSRISSSQGSGFPRHPMMCLTQDGLPFSHLEQATRLCSAGAKWIQLRMKDAEREKWLATAQSIAALCREHGAIFIVNDSVDIALQVGADGVHLGKLDLGWAEARQKLGPDRLLGGTINNEFDVARARAEGCLDYVGVGPWRFTPNKKNLAPVLGADGVRPLIAGLGNLPAWVIGGIEASDLPAVRRTGAAGAAVSSALYWQGDVENNFRALSEAWKFGTDFAGAGRATSNLFTTRLSDRPRSPVPIL